MARLPRYVIPGQPQGNQRYRSRIFPQLIDKNINKNKYLHNISF